MSRAKLTLMTLGLVLIPYLVQMIRVWHQVPIHDGIAVGPGDPDVWLRLTMVREWITSGDWYNHIIPNYNIPYGSVNHWTRPVDLVVRSLAWCMPDANLNDRLIHAAMIMPFIWRTLLLLGVFRIVRRYSHISDSILMSGVMLMAMPLTFNYFGLGNADHHAPLAVLFIWILSIVTQQTLSRKGAVLAGFMLALMLWISIEGIFMIAIIYGWFGLLWLLGKRDRANMLRPLAISCFLGSVIALAVEFPPAHWLVPVYDAISIVYVTILFFASIVAACMSYTTRMPLLHRLTIVGLVTGASTAILIHSFPDIVHGPLAQTTTFIREEFAPTTSEAKSVFTRPLLEIIAFIIYPVAMVAIAIVSLVNSRFTYYRREESLPIIYFCTTLLLMFCTQIRWNYYLYPWVIATLSPLYGALFKPDDVSVIGRWPATMFQRVPKNKQPIIRILIVIGSLALPIGLFMLSSDETYQSDGTFDEKTRLRKEHESCLGNTAVLIRSGELTRALGRQPKTILLSTDSAIEVIFFTPHRVIASNYHRDGDAMEYVWKSFSERDPKALRAKLAKRHIDAIINCPDATGEPGILYDYLTKKAELPHWLKSVHYTLPEIKDPEILKNRKVNLLPQLLLVSSVAN